VGKDDAVRVLPLLLSITLLGGCGAASADKPATGASPGYHGVEPQPVLARPQYVLTDTSGRSYDFQAETKGRPTYVYFGYTHCPDLCPTAMADIAAALRKVSPALRTQARVVFVTTDPTRDTASVLRRWLDQFSTDFIGLLGSPAALAAAQTVTGIRPAYPDGVTPTLAGHPDQHVSEKGTAPHEHFGPLGYAVAHSAVIFAYDSSDHLPVVYPGGVTPSDIADDLPLLARKSTS